MISKDCERHAFAAPTTAQGRPVAFDPVTWLYELPGEPKGRAWKSRPTWALNIRH